MSKVFVITPSGKNGRGNFPGGVNNGRGKSGESKGQPMNRNLCGKMDCYVNDAMIL